ncbi:hypothetical protein ACFQ8C_06605 [Streptomyces sp. NPDC056503]|uniref:hypothetical protein n=1 Tax=Streptomyces sp. NPDC056503 TaxID=3345842 RepID=UPI00368E7914
MAVGVVSAVSLGAANAVGDAVGTAVTEVVRDRLTGTERGRGALEALDADPGSTAARSEVREVLREEIEADSEWGRQLASRLHTTVRYNRDAVVITSSRISRSHIVLGPLTIDNTPGSRAFLAVTAALLLVLLTLGAYGGVQILTSDDAPDGGHAGASGSPGDTRPPAPEGRGGSENGDPGRGPTGVLTQEETQTALPTVQSMPAGWTLFDNDVLSSVEPPTECHADGVQFENDRPKDVPADTNQFLVAWFRFYSCPSSTAAAAKYQETVDGEAGRTAPTPVALPPLGDSSSAVFTGHGAVSVVRVGSVVVLLNYRPVGSLSAHEGQIRELTRMAAERVQQVLAGT